MNTGFIEVSNNKSYYDEDFPEMVCREILRIDSIQHVYVILPEEEALCIEYKNRSGIQCDVVESFDSRGRCAVRFNEISKILCKGEE